VTDVSGDQAGTRQRVEIVERKGLGHPDTIADAIAERFSELYSAFSLAEFGDVAHHWVDKTMAIGGEADLRFGSSRMVKPIRVLVVGKATRVVGDAKIPVEDIALQAAADVFSGATPLLDMRTDVTVEVDLNDAVGAGRTAAWYRPAAAEHMGGDTQSRSNDTVMCNGYAPLSRLESLVLHTELLLNSGELRSHWPAIGSDIKVLARRVDSDVDIVCCVPNVARLVASRSEYDACKAAISELVNNLCASATPEFNVKVSLNTRDGETVYLTHSGSALDTGDVGVVGRGNKLNGVIPLCREAGIEAPCGKNPTYHGGRIYSIVAQCIADTVWRRLGVENSVNIVAANGDRVDRPSFVAVKTVGATGDETSKIEQIVSDALGALNRPSRELPIVLAEMTAPPVDRLTTAGWVASHPLTGATVIKV
jgi:S-adenosylmethionine synthetase